MSTQFGYLQGGLGNQLFIIAALYRYQERVDPTCRVVFTARTNIGQEFAVHPRDSYENTLLSWIQRLPPQTPIHSLRQLPIITDHIPSKLDRSCLFFGYFQDRDLVTPLPTVMKDQLLARKPARGAGKESFDVGVHIRRGDYVTLQHIYVYLSSSYYTRALQKVHEHYRRPLRVIIVSDDLESSRHTVCSSENWSVQVSTGQTDEDDFWTLVDCPWIITANSTFSWWAAVLHHEVHESPGTICPRSWFRDRTTPNFEAHVPRGEWVSLEVEGI